MYLDVLPPLLKLKLSRQILYSDLRIKFALSPVILVPIVRCKILITGQAYADLMEFKPNMLAR